ncbi:cupin domain-containing protein [Methylocapsa acidiphila]|uniref:cupin domain-containing protein n=1 Tax=Methylocapsa acidiphila TaxID=133552 RepID=UPI0024734C35|nr:cupin domain-containing protein [Methylocapsa acidiphila]
MREGGSIEKLARVSGLGKKLLDAIVRSEVAPTLDVLWRIANALGVPFGSLAAHVPQRGLFVLRNAGKKTIASPDGGLTARPLFSHDRRRRAEFYELTLAPGRAAHSEAHAPGTHENLIVAHGRIEIHAGREPPQRLDEGDAIGFDGDVPHSYRNLGASEALIYLVMTYFDPAEL